MLRSSRVGHQRGEGEPWQRSFSTKSRRCTPTAPRPSTRSPSTSPTESSWSSSARRAAARRLPCGWSPGWRRSPAESSGSANGSSTTFPRATATSRWSSRAMRSIRTSRSTTTSPSASGSRRCRSRRSSGASSNAAQVLGLEPFLKRKPRALSGGQRQRVAMGRAIVREPAAFLMDEPLSNLDAKLRVQMRAEVSRLQRDLGTTTIYVTHDQVEAMTMGDRVAVMRKGRAAAGRRSADPVRPARQSLRRGLHRLARHEHDRGDGDARERRACGGRRHSNSSSSTTRCWRGAPPCAATRAGPSSSGIRPEDLEEVSLEPDTRAGPPAAGRRGAA